MEIRENSSGVLNKDDETVCLGVSVHECLCVCGGLCAKER